uniref:Uncharacterized protein n=1 Tax=Salvator merianae TaxID=96440 RepID=A0A8D0BMM6_SALMN
MARYSLGDGRVQSGNGGSQSPIQGKARLQSKKGEDGAHWRGALSASFSPSLSRVSSSWWCPLSELWVIDLCDKLKHRNLDTSDNKEVGGNPDGIPVIPEKSGKKTPKRTLEGHKPEEEGSENNRLEEN